MTMKLFHLSALRVFRYWFGLVAAVVLALVLLACTDEGVPKLDVPDESDKVRATVDIELGTTKVTASGRQNIWVSSSNGWNPCAESHDAKHPPEDCWIRVMIDDTQIAVVLPEPDGTFGPFPIAIHFDVFEFDVGSRQIQFVQVGRLEVRETNPLTLEFEAPSSSLP